MSPDSTELRAALRGLCGGAVHLPGDPGYDAARAPWDRSAVQRPAAVAYPGDVTEVAALVRAAARARLRVVVQCTGRRARDDLAGTVLLRTAGLRGIVVDAARRTLRVGAGVLWTDAVEAAAEHGLAARHGLEPDVGVIAHTLTGGLGWYGRHLGLGSSAVRAVELVTGTGEIVRADSHHETELLWALRGGGAAGVVTAVELDLHDPGSLRAGTLCWPSERAPFVLAAWSLWAAQAPDRVVTAVDAPGAGRPVTIGVVVQGAGDSLGALRELRPHGDSVGPAPLTAPLRLLPTPSPARGPWRTGVLGCRADPQALAEAGARGTPLRVLQAGGAMERPSPVPAALDRVPGRAVVSLPARAGAGLADIGHLARLAPPAVPSSVRARLAAVRRSVDPDGLFR